MKELVFTKKGLFLGSIVGLFCTSVAIPMANATVTKDAFLESVKNSTVRLDNILTQTERKRQTIGNTVITAQSVTPNNALIQLRTFIPCGAVNFSVGNLSIPKVIGIVGGDNRGFTGNPTIAILDDK